jgi:hypothetical protein
VTIERRQISHEEPDVYQVLRHEAEAEWVDISEETLLQELRHQGCVNPYAVAARLKTGDPLVSRLARYRWTGDIVRSMKAKRTLAYSASRHLQPKSPYKPRRALIG